MVDTFPPGFKYVAGSARSGWRRSIEPAMNRASSSGANLLLATNTKHTITLLMIVGSGRVRGGVREPRPGDGAAAAPSASGVATATVRVVPDPHLDCTDVIGKVFDDANINGYPDQGETGPPRRARRDRPTA